MGVLGRRSCSPASSTDLQLAVVSLLQLPEQHVTFLDALLALPLKQSVCSLAGNLSAWKIPSTSSILSNQLQGTGSCSNDVMNCSRTRMILRYTAHEFLQHGKTWASNVGRCFVHASPQQQERQSSVSREKHVLECYALITSRCMRSGPSRYHADHSFGMEWQLR